MTDPIEYLLNAMEHAAQSNDPFANNYGAKRRAVLDAIKQLRAELADAVRAREASERDAKRYCYLRDNFDGFDAGHGEPPRYVLTFQFPPDIRIGLGDKFDAAIDEAMRGVGR